VINEEKLEPEEDAQNNKSIFTGLPTELQLNITKFFQTNPDTIRNFRAVSKHTYKLQKSIQDAPGNIYFTLGNEIMITRKRKRHEASVLICLTDRLESNELLNATKLSPNKSLNLFASLYDAIEYAHFLKHGGDMFSREANGYIPAILAVSYIGDSKELDSEEEIITINEGTSCSSYMDSQRKVAVSYIPKVEARAVLPLAAICLYGDSNNFSVFRSDFISFRVFGQILNLNKLLCKPDVNLEPNSKCTIM
jgi:hypothetical protein